MLDQSQPNTEAHKPGLSRSLSIPAEIVATDRALSSGTLKPQVPEPESLVKRRMQPVRHNSLEQTRFNRQHRRSHCDRACPEHLQDEAKGRAAHQGNHSGGSSTSSSRSSASDSAFSNSRTTLESDSCERTSNCFTRSIKNTMNSSECSTPSSRLSGQTTIIEEAHCSRDHFKISWRNLTYEVPEKRFAKITSRIAKCKAKIWPSDDEPEIFDDLPAEGSLVDEPTLRRPIIGKPRKLIFSDLNGCVRSGELTAILGPSGAGKTTLLKCLTNSIESGVSGSIDITGGPASSSQKQIKLCSIPQKGKSSTPHKFASYLVIV